MGSVNIGGGTEGSQTFGGTTGYPSHAETRQLVEYGGDRTQRPERTMS